MEIVLFFVTATIALTCAIAMLVSPNAVHSALFLLLNFGAVSILFLLLRAPFLFAIQLSIYAGAIMVLFLFVVMLLGAERAEDEREKTVWQRPLALVMGVVLLIESLVVSISGIAGRGLNNPATLAKMDTFGAPAEIGKVLFTRYLLPFEIAAVILLVAIVGVVVLNRGRQKVVEETS